MGQDAVITSRVSSPERFSNPDVTAKGDIRARVPLKTLETLWFNTGTLCNITCRSCYIESSPTNDRLVYLTLEDITPFLAEARAAGTREIGFTGGEPFLNPDMCAMLDASLAHGFDVLVLTNAMLPMRRPAVAKALLRLRETYGDKLGFRVSLDHYSAELHDVERGKGSFAKAVDGMDWLNANGFPIAIAGRTCWGEDLDAARDGYHALIRSRDWRIDRADAEQLMLFPEMEAGYDGPEITSACWGILGIDPASIMCATSRMVVRRKGAERAVVLPCTLLPYDAAFEMGASLADAARADGGMFDDGAVKLCHPNCAKFCVLGGGSCS